MRNAHAEFVSAYVDTLLQSGDLHTGAVERAFRCVRRHRFLDHWYRLESLNSQMVWSRVDFDREGADQQILSTIYSDCSLVTGIDGNSPTTSTSQPRLMARMLEALALKPGMRVLEIGTGTGYNAALLAETLGDPSSVYSVELRPEISEQAGEALCQEGYADVRLFARDGAFGAPEGAPFDRIVVTAACSDIAPAWLDQLGPGGMLLAPIQHGHLDPLLEIRVPDSAAGLAAARAIGNASFMPLVGVLAGPNAWQSYLIGGMVAASDGTRDAPFDLPEIGDAHPLTDPMHQAIHFFLALASRELWQTNAGYGLADPHDGTAALVTSVGLQTLCRPGAKPRAEELAAKLTRLLLAWDDLGRPRPADYDIVFESRPSHPKLQGHGREWVIERTRFWEIVRLAERERLSLTSTREGTHQAI